MDITDKDIIFDHNGVCNYCLYAEKRKPFTKSLYEIVEKMKREGIGKKYDCLIGLSGGMDSSLALHYVIELGLRPMCFSIDNNWNSKLADENIMKMVETLKVPFYRYTLDKEATRSFYELQVAFLAASVPNAEIPTDHILGASLYKVAKEHKTKYIISGGNYANEGTMPFSWSYPARDLVHIKAIYKKFVGKKLKNIPMMSLWKYLICRNRIETINLLDYYDYNQDGARKLLKEKYDWQDYGNKHCESKYTQWFQEYYLPRKFHIDKRKAHLTSLIHSGQITRDEALKELAVPLSDHQDISREIMTRFELPPAQFDRMMGLPPMTYKDYENSQWQWKTVFGIIHWLRKYLKISL